MKHSWIRRYVRIRNLYIPHGSDETFFKKLRKQPKAYLYIPHGSDETTNGFINLMLLRCFISHTVQMKR